MQTAADLVGQRQPAARHATLKCGSLHQSFLMHHLESLDRQEPRAVKFFGKRKETLGRGQSTQERRDNSLDELRPGQVRLPAEAGKGEIADLDGGDIIGWLAPDG